MLYSFVQQSSLSVEQNNAFSPSPIFSTLIRVLLLSWRTPCSSLIPIKLMKNNWLQSLTVIVFQQHCRSYCIPLRKHFTPAFSEIVSWPPQLCWGRQSSKLLSDPPHPTSSRKNGSVLTPNWLSDCIIASASAINYYCDKYINTRRVNQASCSRQSTYTVLVATIPSPECPSCLHTTAESFSSHSSSHTLPHCWFLQTSTLPSR